MRKTSICKIIAHNRGRNLCALLTIGSALVCGSYNSAIATEVSAGGYYSLVLKDDGTLWAVGNNAFGQLGDGSLVEKTTAVQVLSDVKAFSAGPFHSLAVKSNGTVWAWGFNGHSQLGNGSTADSTTPTQISSLSGIQAVSAGMFHSLALKTNGTVWAWGDNGFCQLGNGTTTDQSTPVQVSGLTNVTAIATKTYHSLAISNGVVYAWGHNSHGQLGDGTTTTRSTPVPIYVPGDSIDSIAVGWTHSVASSTSMPYWPHSAYTESDVYAWGRNNVGQVGDGTTTDRTTPVHTGLYSLLPFKVSAGYLHSAALSGGYVRTWGYNNLGQLGNGTTTSSTTPVLVTNLTGATRLSTGLDHNIAVSNNIPFAWGLNSNGQLGDGLMTDSSIPVNAGLPVLIGGQPLNRNACTNDTSFFLVAQRGGIGPFTYQWFKNGSAITGATDFRYPLNNTVCSDFGQYKCHVTNSFGTVISPTAVYSNFCAQCP